MSLVRFDELQKMSGKETPEDVAQWLKDYRVPHVLACDNKPITLSEWIPREALAQTAKPLAQPDKRM